MQSESARAYERGERASASAREVIEGERERPCRNFGTLVLRKECIIARPLQLCHHYVINNRGSW